VENSLEEKRRAIGAKEVPRRSLADDVCRRMLHPEESGVSKRKGTFKQIQYVTGIMKFDVCED
jgi:hypothetical protein